MAGPLLTRLAHSALVGLPSWPPPTEPGTPSARPVISTLVWPHAPAWAERVDMFDRRARARSRLLAQLVKASRSQDPAGAVARDGYVDLLAAIEASRRRRGRSS